MKICKLKDFYSVVYWYMCILLNLEILKKKKYINSKIIKEFNFY